MSEQSCGKCKWCKKKTSCDWGWCEFFQRTKTPIWFGDDSLVNAARYDGGEDCECFEERA